MADSNLWRSQLRIVPVAKYSSLVDEHDAAKNDYIVRGGDYVEVFHRQSQGYLSVDSREGHPKPTLYRPIEDSAEVDPQSIVSAEFVWKIMLPLMAWSGNHVMATRDRRGQGYCLHAAMMTGKELFLAEDEKGEVSLSPHPERKLSQWNLVPFDDDMSSSADVHYEETRFFLVNAQSGKVLHQVHQVPAQGEGEHTEDDKTASFGLQLLDPSQDHESDAFVLHALGVGASARHWLKDFQAGEEGLDGLWRFQHELEMMLALRSCLEKGQDHRNHGKVMTHFSPRLHKQHHEAVAREVVAKANDKDVDIKEQTRLLYRKFVHPPAHNWDDWAAPVLSDLRFFISSLVSGAGNDPLKWMGTVDREQQEILQGLGLIKFMVQLIQAVYELIGTQEVNILRDALNTDSISQAKWQEDEESRYHPESPGHDRYILLLVRACFHLLNCMVKDNSAGAMELFAHQGTLLDVMGHGFGVTAVVADMFDGTPELLQSKELTRFAETFWQQCLELRRERFPHFLAQVCFDENEDPLDSNQMDVVNCIRNHLPDDIFEESGSSDKVTVVDGIPHKEQTQRYTFNLSMVNLAAATCAGHMQSGLRLWLEEAPQFNFTYVNILSKIANPNADVAGYRAAESWDVRRAYVNAMREMYVDRQASNIAKQTRQRARIWPGLDLHHLSSLPLTSFESDQVIGPPPTPGFTDLKTVLNKILTELAGDVNAEELSRNQFILEVLRLVQFMIRQGYYDPRNDDPDSLDDGSLLLGPELKMLVPLLVALLDGRGDIGHLGRKDRDHLDMMEIEVLSRPGSSARFGFNRHNLIVMELKTTSLKILNDLFGMQASSRVKYTLEQLSDQLALKGSDKSAPDSSHSNGTMEDNSMENPLRVAPVSVATFEVEDSPTADGSALDELSAPPPPRGPSVSNGNSNADPSDSKDLVLAQKACKAVLKADESFQKDHKLFTGKTDDTVVTDILLDGLRYHYNTDLVLSSFAALYNFRAEQTRFHQLLQEVTLLESEKEAELFLVLHSLCMSYQRAVQQLSEENYATLCITLAEQMIQYCTEGDPERTATARILLRNLDIEQHLAVMLRTHPNDIHEPSYFELLQATLECMAAFCTDEDEAWQCVLADYMEGTILPLFEGGPYGGDPALTYVERKRIMLMVSNVLPKLFAGNRDLAIASAKTLVAKTVEAIRAFGKHHVLLDVLHVLVQVDGKSVEYAQTQVSKGLIEKSRRVLDCALDENEWGEGPAMAQTEVLVHAMQDDDDSRSSKELDYYCALLELMGLCARGLMPHTELQAASMLSFDRVVSRINNLFLHEGLQPYQHLDRLTEVKRATLLFLNDVFIDSDSEFVQTLVREQHNGLWTVGDEQRAFRKPIAELLCGDIASLDAHSSPSFRSYVMKEACSFFVLYAVGSPQEDEKMQTVAQVELAKAESNAKRMHMSRVGEIASKLLNSTQALRCMLYEDERLVLQHLHDIVQQWLAMEGLPSQSSESLHRAGADKPDRQRRQRPETLVHRTWSTYGQQFAAKHGVDFTKSSGASAQLLNVARDIVMDIPDDLSADARYSGSLLRAIDSRIDAMMGVVSCEMPDKEVRNIRSVLDVIRAVPFTVHGDETKLSEDQILTGYLSQDNSIFDNPSIATSESQIVLVREGWGLLCWKILSVSSLRGLHLPAVRLLSTLVGGGNYEVQTCLHEDLTDKSKCARELLGSSCRRIFTNACNEFRLIRKKKRASAERDDFNIAAHTINVLCSSCMYLHRGFQDYIPSQSGHEETFLLIPDIYELIVEMEREMAVTVKGSSSVPDDQTDAELAREHGEEPSDKALKFGAHSRFSLIDMFESAIHLLVNLVSGPHKTNALMVASSGIIMVISRVMKYANIESMDDIKYLTAEDPSPSRFEEHWNPTELIRCRLCCYSTELLLALLEGTPDTQVVLPICQSLDFQVWSHHMRTLKSIAEGRASFGTIPDAQRACAWVNAQSFAMITVIEKLVASNLSRAQMGPLTTVLKQKPLLDHFKARLGQVLVVREGATESLYFDLAMLPNEMTDPSSVGAQMLAIEVENLLDKSYDRHAEDIGRLSTFFEGVMEHAWQIDRNIEIAPHLDRAHDIANGAVAQRLLTIISSLAGKWTLLGISAILNLVLLLSLKPSDDDSEADTLDRWGPGKDLLWLLCRLHVLFSFLRAVHFVLVRNPVLAKVQAREKMIRRLGRLNQKEETGSTFAEFIACTIHLKDLPRGITESQIRSILGVYGEIQLVQVWGSKSVEALVCFLREDAVDRVSESRVEAPASLWKQHRYFERVKSASASVTRSIPSRTQSREELSKLPPKDARRVLVTDKITVERAKRSSGTFSEQVDIAARKYLEGEEQHRSISEQIKLTIIYTRGRTILSRIQGILKVLIRSLQGPDKGFLDDDCGFVLTTSKEQLSSFRLNAHFFAMVLDLLFSLLGRFHNNLWFAFHLMHAFKMHGAKIVMQSVTRNSRRLVLTVLLAIVAIYIMAILGYTQFREDHLEGSAAKTGNPGGACSTLLTCFVSYTFAGFVQTGLIYWLNEPEFPEGNIADEFWQDDENGFLGPVFNGHGTRLLFEMLFMVIITTVVVAIITGIIVDTFSELRAQQENALAYRKTTCFITGVSFGSAPERKATSYMQYVFLIVFLRRKAHKAARPLMPLERYVANMIDQGDTSWVPSVGNRALGGGLAESLGGQETLGDLGERETKVEQRLAALEDKLSEVAELLENAPARGLRTLELDAGDSDEAAASGDAADV
eukprot:COSAG06_NODE_143_length_22242_cov_21.978323_13_plen_2744_part_00